MLMVPVSSHGFAVTADYSLNGGYTIGGNVSFNKLIDQDELIRQGFRASYNTTRVEIQHQIPKP